MAQSTTITASRTTLATKPRLKLAVPFFNPRKSEKPWEGLLMEDPGSDYDQHEARLFDVECMLEMACDSGCYTKMANWRNQPVFDDDDEFTPIVKRVDSMMDVSDGRDVDEKTKVDKAAKEKSIWKDPSSIWREADKAKKESQTNEYGLWYGKPW